MLGRKRNRVDANSRMDRVLRDVERRRAAGATVDSESVLQAHPELMPELGDRLKALEQIESAARRAKRISDQGRTDCETEVIDEFLAEEWRSLSDALPEYELLEPLRHGGQGIVYRAVERATGRAVALKVLLDGPLASERQRQRFAREIALDSRLRHPNIVTLFHSGVVRGRPFFAMEYIDGLPVDDYALLRELSSRDIVSLFVQIARTIMYAHQRGIIHRDIKPSNILIDADGSPHLLDFGLAKDLSSAGEESDTSPSMAGSVVGTLPYSSPEQVDADGDVDTRSDIYSLAVVLFEVLTGVFPYPVDGDAQSVRRTIRQREPARLSDVLGQADGADELTVQAINDDLETILLKALAKEKSERYQTMGELADDLERYLNGDAVHAKADRRFYVLRKNLRKYRVHVTVACVFLAVLVVSSALVTTQWLRARRERDNARETAEITHRVLLTTLNDVIEKTGRLPGGIEVGDPFLAGLVDDLDRLDELMQSTELRAAWREQRGALAQIQGQWTEAETQYRILVDIQRVRLETEPSAQKKLALIKALRELGRHSTQWDGLFREAVATGAALDEEAPGRSQIDRTTCRTHLAYARRLCRAAEYVRAAEHIDAALALCPRPPAPGQLDNEWSDIRADIFDCDGDIRVPLGQAPRADQSYQRSLAIRQAQLDEQPFDVIHAFGAMGVTTKLARLKHDAGHVEEANTLFIRAAAMGEHLLMGEPYNAMVRLDLIAAFDELATYYKNRDSDGDKQRALDYSTRTMQLVGTLSAADPQSPQWRRRWGRALKLHGKVLLACGRADDAYNHLTDALTEFETLRADGYDETRIAIDTSYAHDWLVKTCRELGRSDEELHHAHKSYEIRSELLRMNPAVVDFAKQVVVAQAKIANWHFDQDTPEHNRLADEWCAKAETLLQSLFESGRLVGREGKFHAWRDKIGDYRRQLAERLQSSSEHPSGTKD